VSRVFEALAVATLALHLAWILWVVLGWLVTRNRPWLRWFHLGSLGYAIGIELFLWPCPLTYAENYLKRRADLEPYSEPFLIHYLEAVIYPDLNQTLITSVAVAVCLGILGLYAWRFHHRHATAGW
jgi:hypothetical protein